MSDDYITGEISDIMYHLAIELAPNETARKKIETFMNKMDKDDIPERVKRFNLSRVMLRICSAKKQSIIPPVCNNK